MLLNPKKIKNQQEVVQGSIYAQDPFDAPIPGQSLTDEPGKWAWEKPPEITDVDEAVESIVIPIMEDPDKLEQVDKLMMTGLPIESMVNTLAFTGFAEGKWTPDVAELIKPPLSAFFIIRAMEENIPAILYNNPRAGRDGMSDELAMESMREGNPEAFEHLQQQVSASKAPPPPITESNFLDMEQENLLAENEATDMGGIA